MYADLHIHTYFSDGEPSPEDVVSIAKERGLSIISVCDHNTIEAYERLIPACAAAGLTLVKGVELDATWNNENIHVLAYNFDFHNHQMQELLKKNQEEYDLIHLSLIEAMSRDTPCISLSDFRAYTMPLGRGGWKSINYLYDRGLSDDVLDAIKYHAKYEHYYPTYNTLEDICRIVREAGGVPVLAHPGKYWQDHEISPHLGLINNTGLEGIECYYPLHSETFTASCIDFCKRHNWRITCGGDGHGDFGMYARGSKCDIAVMKVDVGLLNLQGILDCDTVKMNCPQLADNY